MNVHLSFVDHILSVAADQRVWMVLETQLFVKLSAISQLGYQKSSSFGAFLHRMYRMINVTKEVLS